MIILIIAIRESVIYYKIEWDLLTESLNSQVKNYVVVSFPKYEETRHWSWSWTLALLPNSCGSIQQIVRSNIPTPQLC